jgi:hypothetical protein
MARSVARPSVNCPPTTESFASTVTSSVVAAADPFTLFPSLSKDVACETEAHRKIKIFSEI